MSDIQAIAPKEITKANDPILEKVEPLAPLPGAPILEPVVPVTPVVSDAQVQVIEQDIKSQDDAKIAALKAEMTAQMEASLATMKAEYETKLTTEKNQILEEISSRKGLVSQPTNPYEAPAAQQQPKEVTNADIITHMKTMSGEQDAKASEEFLANVSR